MRRTITMTLHPLYIPLTYSGIAILDSPHRLKG
jgi:hypothetical protein